MKGIILHQTTFSELEYAQKKKKAGKGRHPYPLSTMLRIHCVQLFYNLSDPAMEDMLYEIESVRRFTRLNITGPIPDESTILKFRHLLEAHKLGGKLFNEINKHLEDRGLILKEGAIIDASIITAPTSTKNQKSERDPEMHQGREADWHISMRPGKRRQLDPDCKEAEDEKSKASIRAKVEHPFNYVKRIFGYDKVRYRGLEKNTHRISLLLAFTNLLIGDRYECI